MQQIVSDNEISLLNNVMEFNGYPAHFVLDPEGRVIENNSIHTIYSGGKLSEYAVKKLTEFLAE